MGDNSKNILDTFSASTSLLKEERNLISKKNESKPATKKKKIKVLFVSAVPAIIVGIISLFSNDAVINLDTKKYTNTNQLFNIETVDYDIIIYDDNYSCIYEILNSNMSCRTYNNKLKTKRIIYTDKQETGYLKNIIDSGVEGIVSKSSGKDKLREAIISVTYGETYFCENIFYASIFSNKFGNILSPREREVIYYLREGLTYKEIAAKLFLSPKTILRHTEDMKKKLNFNSFDELLRNIKT